MTIDGSGRQARIATCFLSCKDYIYDDFKSIYTLDTRQNCSDLAPTDERYTMCLYEDDECEQTIHEQEFGWGPIQITVNIGLIAMIFATPC